MASQIPLIDNENQDANISKLSNQFMVKQPLMPKSETKEDNHLIMCTTNQKWKKYKEIDTILISNDHMYIKFSCQDLSKNQIMKFNQLYVEIACWTAWAFSRYKWMAGWLNHQISLFGKLMS